MNLEQCRLKIFNKIINDFINKNVIMANRNDEFYKLNKLKNYGGRDEGYALIMGDDFYASFNFKNNSSFNYLYLYPTTDQTSECFQNFINTVDQNIDDLIYVEENNKLNLINLIYNHSKITIYNIEINNDLLFLLNDRFNLCSEISFINCTLNPLTNFSTLKNKNIEFKNLKINDFNTFNLSNNDYEFYDCNININKVCKLDSEKLKFIRCNIDYKSLFLTCLAENLKELKIINLDTLDKNDNYQYLYDFAPNLEIIEIEGQLTSTKFLTKFKYLKQLSINSYMNALGTTFPAVNNSNELKRLEKLNNEEIEIKKIIMRYSSSEKLPNHLVSELEINRILKLCSLNKQISYTEEEKQNFKNIFNHYSTLPNYVNDKDFIRLDNGYYEVNYNNLNLNHENLKKPNKTLFSWEDRFVIIGNYLAVFNYQTKIIKGKGKLFLYIDGRPIIFNKSNSISINSKEKAEEFIKQFPEVNNTEENDSTQFIDYIIEEFFNNENYSVNNKGEFNDVEFVNFSQLCIGERAGVDPLHPKIKALLLNKLKSTYGEQLRELYKCFDEYDNIKLKEETIINENKKLLTKCFNLIINNINNFDSQQLLMLYKIINNYSIYNNMDFNINSTSFILKVLEYFNINICLNNYDIKQFDTKIQNNVKALEINNKAWQTLNTNNIILTKRAIDQIFSAKRINKTKTLKNDYTW